MFIIEELAKSLQLWITSLTTCLLNAIEHVAKSGAIGREKPKEITAEVQGNYPDFKQKLAEKEYFVISKVSQSQPLFSKCRIRATRFQKLTTRALARSKLTEAENFGGRKNLAAEFLAKKIGNPGFF